jgi:metal-sulfur cluster biosynthetic enzyme
VKADQYDQGTDLGLGGAQKHDPAPTAQPARQHGQIEHQRGVGEGQVAEIDHEVTLGPKSTGQRSASEALGCPVLVAGASQDGRIVRELDDPGNLYKREAIDNAKWSQFLGRPRMRRMVAIEEVNDALRDVIDPELGLDFVELGLIYGVDVNPEGVVKVTFTLTSPGCPIGPQVSEQIEEFVGDLEGVTAVESEMVFTPPWTPERMSEDAKFALGF